MFGQKKLRIKGGTQTQYSNAPPGKNTKSKDTRKDEKSFHLPVHKILNTKDGVSETKTNKKGKYKSKDKKFITSPVNQSLNEGYSGAGDDCEEDAQKDPEQRGALQRMEMSIEEHLIFLT